METLRRLDAQTTRKGMIASMAIGVRRVDDGIGNELLYDLSRKMVRSGHRDWYDRRCACFSGLSCIHLLSEKGTETSYTEILRLTEEMMK